jgi:hypothetical protein
LSRNTNELPDPLAHSAGFRSRKFKAEPRLKSSDHLAQASLGSEHIKLNLSRARDIPKDAKESSVIGFGFSWPPHSLTMDNKTPHVVKKTG